MAVFIPAMGGSVKRAGKKEGKSFNRQGKLKMRRAVKHLDISTRERGKYSRGCTKIAVGRACEFK
jgi:hypothetical protein